MRANEAATTQATPAALMASGACSRELPQPKFSSATMMSPGRTRAHELGVDVLHAVTRELRRVARVEVASGDDDVGVHVAPVLVHRSFELHLHRPHFPTPIISGVAMWPATAEAAATYGLAR